MLELQNVTLCGVDTRTPLLALQALRRSMREICFGDAVLFAPLQPALQQEAANSGVRVIDPGRVQSIEQYSRFVLQGIAEHVRTEFVLITQWDGFVLNPHVWTNEFLEYDYIGALWRDVSPQDAVGNGGFSLRSRRLLQAMMDPDMVISHPEDLCICQVNRGLLQQRHGIRFAPPALAARFSYEHIRSNSQTFGFHGIFNLIDALSPDEMRTFTRDLTTDMAFGAGARGLARALVYGGQYEAARQLLNKRIRGGDRRWRTLSLWVRMWLRQSLGIRRDER